MPKSAKPDRMSDLVTKGDIVLEVTIKRVYIFPKNCSNGWNAKELVKYVFEDYSINESHVHRDGSHVGNSDVITDIKILRPGEVTEIEKVVDRLKQEKNAKAGNKENHNRSVPYKEDTWVVKESKRGPWRVVKAKPRTRPLRRQ